MDLHIDLNTLPRPADRNIALYVKPAAERALKQRHPWLFEGSIREQSKEGDPGDLAIVFDSNKHFLAVGLYDPASPIRLKVFQHHDPATIGQAFYEQRLQEAVQRRATLQHTETTGYRLVHGEGDFLPGLVIDRYDETLVIKLYSEAWLAHLADFLPALEAVIPAERWILRLSRYLQQQYTYGLEDGQTLKGEPPQHPVIFQEYGITFAADVIKGHKTGFFFDQRENRRLAAQYADGKRVLDMFSYNGGFSLHAAAAGAYSVLSVDSSTHALASAAHNMALNTDRAEVRACQHETMASDAFEALIKLHTQGRTFELVVVDPPAFAQNQSDVDKALGAYARLTDLALKIIDPGGILVMASCSSRVSPDAFYATVHNAAIRAEKPLKEIERTGHAPDHPVPNSFPEGRYLKCLFSRVPE
jgi:23S rRNA (cytosine1962-C5)-methyltransferase